MKSKKAVTEGECLTSDVSVDCQKFNEKEFENQFYRRRAARAYICSGAEIPKILKPFAKTTFVARDSALRALESSFSGITTLWS